MKKIIALVFFTTLIINHSYADLDGSGFYRLQNAESLRYGNLIDDYGTFYEDYHAIQMISNGTQFIEPGTVIYAKKNSNGWILYAAGTSTYDIVGSYMTVTSAGTGALGTKYTAGASIAQVEDEGGKGFDQCYSWTSTNYKYWYFNPIDMNGSGSEYFGIKPLESNRLGDFYYTTLRTSFSYNLSSTVHAFVVKKNDNVYFLEEVTGTIPANTPVILQTTSINPSDNRVFPVAIGGSYSEESSITSNLVSGTSYEFFKTNAPNAASKNGSFTKGQMYGLGTNFSENNANYKVLSVKNGKLGFFDKFSVVYPNDLCINGELAYMNTTEDIVLLEEANLASIVENGTEGAAYLTHNLYGVKAVNGKLYAKDYGQYAYPSVNSGNAIDYMDLVNLQQNYDQSNWVALNVDNPASYVGKDLQVTGTLLRKPNPEMNVTSIKASDPANSGYTPNVYIPASFMGETQSSTHNTYFFVTPKPNEYAHITWAVYGGDSKFYISAPEGSVNQALLKGGFIADGALIGGLSSFESGNTYMFDAIIQVNTSGKSPYTAGGYSSNYTVYPTSAPTIITAVNDVNVTKTVAGIKYYNLAGVASDQPFDGINIVVTTYSDGTRQASKIRF